MAKMRDFLINNYAGGLVRNKSDYLLKNNEVKNSLNFTFDDPGRAERRMGSRQWAQAISSVAFDNSFLFTRYTAGSSSVNYHLLITRAASATVYQLVGGYNTIAVAAGDSTVTIDDVSDFATSGTAEIGGETFTYTGVSGGTTFTGVNGVNFDHATFTPVNQLISSGTPNMDTRFGAEFAVLNNTLFISGGEEKYTFDGSTYTLVNDTDAPAGLFPTVYRNQIYVAGSGISDSTRKRNGDPRRVSYSDEGSPTSWDVNNYFDVEDDLGEEITGFREHNDYLLIFKYNSIFTYDEVQLKQRLRRVGAWSHRAIQKINDTLYTFGPNGIYETNGFSARLISDPIKDYINAFRPQFDSVSARVVQNVFSGQWNKQYWVYIGNITEPKVLSDVVLVFDTLHRTWSVYSGFTGINNINYLQAYNSGDATAGTSGTMGTQFGDSLWLIGATVDSEAKLWRAVEDRFLDAESPRTYHGGDLVKDFQSEADSNPVSTVLETKLYDLGNPEVLKIFGYFTIFIEQGNFNLSYRLDKGGYFTDWIPLGNFVGSVVTKEFVEQQGYRIQFKVTGYGDVASILNGILLRDINTKEEIRKINNAA